MKQFGRAVCPYCGKKVNLAITWSLRRRGEYRCPHCLGISNVTLSTAVLSMAFAAIALSALILAATLLFMEEAVWWSVLVVIAPFLLFHIHLSYHLLLLLLLLLLLYMFHLQMLHYSLYLKLFL
mgnify:CR=1 FL=1